MHLKQASFLSRQWGDPQLEVITICIKGGLSTEEELAKCRDLDFMISELSELLTILK